MINNKIYIGCHITQNIDDGYMGSGKLIKLAIEKYGIEYFKKEILYDFKNQDDMYDKERELVNEIFLEREDTYNLQLGGQSGGWFYVNQNFVLTDEIREKRRKAGRKGNEVLREKLKNDEDFRGDYGEFISNKLKEYYKHNTNPFKGKEHSEETKKKIGEASSKRQMGSKNSNYGKRWIYNLNTGETKQVSKDQVDDIIRSNQDWVTGKGGCRTKKKVCKCGKLIATKSKMCNKCTSKMKKKPLPPYEVLKEEVLKTSLRATGRKFGVSYNTIKKWIKLYEKELPTSGG